jgi:hypothetical protein
LAIALVYDPSETLSLRVFRRYLAYLVSPRIDKLWIARLIYRLRDLLWLRCSISALWGMKYLEADPLLNDALQVHPREIRRQAIARSLTVLRTRPSRTIIAQAYETTTIGSADISAQQRNNASLAHLAHGRS